MARLHPVLRALAVALAILLVAEAYLRTRVPPADPLPMPWRNRTEFHWGRDLGGGVHQTHLGQLVERERPPGRLRVAVFGSSAVAGEGTSLDHAFPWRLQRRLERRGLDAEVLNMGLSGQDSSHHRASLERTLAELQPSIVIVYAGNNELHRLRAYRALHPRWSAGWERVRMALDQSALYRWLAAQAPTAPPEAPAKGPGKGLHEIDAPVGPADRDLASGVFRYNLQGMVDACAAAKVPLILCTVAARDDSPPDYGRPGKSPAHVLYARGMRARPQGDFATARQVFEQARELDPAPNRVLPSWNRVVREIPGATVCDVEERLREGAQGGLLGSDLFLDNCHFTVEGHEKVAEILEDSLQDLLPPGSTAR